MKKIFLRIVIINKKNLLIITKNQNRMVKKWLLIRIIDNSPSGTILCYKDKSIKVTFEKDMLSILDIMLSILKEESALMGIQKIIIKNFLKGKILWKKM